MKDKYTVLLIEDDPDVSPVITEVLQNRFNCEIIHLKDGKTVREKVPVLHPDLIITDLMLPGIDGFEICRYVRDHLPELGCPILAITGYDSVENRRKVFLSGANDYLGKPFDVSDFIQKVKKLLKIE